MAERVQIVEVGPRDGLQNEAVFVPVARKIALIEALAASGLRRIEAASFVSPKWVPQMAGSAEVMAGLKRAKGVEYSALTPNLRGYHDAVAAGADGVAVFAAASESFSQANINCSISESFDRFRPIFEAANADNMKVRGYISCVTDCPYEGEIAPSAVAEVAKVLIRAGAYEISLGETLGRGQTDRVQAMLAAVLEGVPATHLAGHFHDTGGRALDNIDAALAAGIRVFDTSVGGLGGCPYAPGAAGNVATGAVVAHMVRRGFDTGVAAQKLAQAADLALEMRAGDGDDPD